MPTVVLRGPESAISDMVARAHTCQRTYTFQLAPSRHAIPVYFMSQESNRPFQVSRAKGVGVNVWQSDGICQYTGLPRGAYLLANTMIAMLVYRAMQLNTLLGNEDFFHAGQRECLYRQRLFLEDYALAFEQAAICSGCVRFYKALMPDEEVDAVLDVMAHLPASRVGRPDPARWRPGSHLRVI